MLTILIGTYNRLETLDRTIKSYKRFKTPHEIVIVDNGTDDQKCLDLLGRLEKKVKKIYSLPGCVSMDEAADNFNVAIRDQYETSGGEWFAVSEADVCFDGTHPEALDVYIRLSEQLGKPVGSHLRVDADIPDHYPLRSRVLACESRLLYKHEMEWFGEIPYSNTQIDTTFHLFPRTRFFNRLHMDPLRVGPPYDAMHLDWYLNIFKPNRENKIYIPGQRPMGSWGKQWIRDFWLNFQKSPELAFERLCEEPLDQYGDLCNNSFLLSWCYQYGHGVEANYDLSKRWLLNAIPDSDDRYYRPYEANWMAMIYERDFGSLGWDA